MAEDTKPTEEQSNKPFFKNAPPGYQWTDTYKDHVRTTPERTGEVNVYKKPDPMQTPFIPDAQAGQEMANYDKLRPWEKKAMEMLPGVVKKFQDSALGKWVGESLVTADKEFDATFLGKILYAIDLPFEGLERTSGLMAQQTWYNNNGINQYEGMSDAEANELTKDMFVAGQFMSDFANLPERTFQDGEFTGFQMDTDLPGVAGMVEAQKAITQLRLTGMDRKDAVDEVRRAVYEEHGALSFRMQIQDLGARIVLDPLNWILPAIKPVKRIQSLAAKALTSKIPRETLEVLFKSTYAAGRLTSEAATAGWTFKHALEAAEEAGTLLGTWDKLAIYLTGGIEAQIGLLDELGNATEVVDVLKLGEGAWWAKNSMTRIANSKIPLVRGVAKQFTMTPETLAYEMLGVFSRQAGVQMRDLNTVEAIEDFFGNIARDIGSKKYGHSIFSIEGQVFTATVKKSMSNVVEPMIKRFKQFKSEVFLLDDLARLFDDPRKITAASLMDDMFTDGIPATVAQIDSRTH